MKTSARLLRLVSLLSTRPSWTNAELAERMEVTERTIRRDVARLRDLGYGLESVPGPWGGYRLARGVRLPPVSLDDEEALAVAVALRETALTGVLGDNQAALSALLKLRRILPSHMAERIAALDSSFVQTSRHHVEGVDAEELLTLASACHHQKRVRLTYRDMQGRQTVRDIAPYQLVRSPHRWYLVAHDVERQAWRTFRVDRVTSTQPTETPADLPETPDAAELVNQMLLSDYPIYTTIRLPVPIDRARRIVPAHHGCHQSDGPDATIVTIGGTNPDQLAAYLISLATPLRIIVPEAVRVATCRHAQQLVNINSTKVVH